MRIGALAHLMLAGLFAALPAHAGEDFSTWSHSAKLHYSTTATGANVPMNIVNFPILVRITDTRILTQSMATGADVRFADEKATTWISRSNAGTSRPRKRSSGCARPRSIP